MESVSSCINQIADSDVRQICSGQVIVSLSSCVKELIENALDASPSSISVKLYNSGADLIEVIDDGVGVQPEDRPLLCAKHATSKLSNFSDLYDDEVKNKFGFRGEALFALSNVSESVTITTRTSSEAVGQKVSLFSLSLRFCLMKTRIRATTIQHYVYYYYYYYYSTNSFSHLLRSAQLTFDNNGKLLSDLTTQVAMKKGTTVQVKNIFASLPVRRTDLLRRLKNQRSNLFKMLQSYALQCVGVKFTVSDNKEENGKQKASQTVKLTTGMTSNLSQLVSSVLGTKFFEGMMSFDCNLDELMSKLNSGNGNNGNGEICLNR